MRSYVLALFAFTALINTAHSVGPNSVLNDTGVTRYGNDARSDLSTEPSSYPGQDARRGRDASALLSGLRKVGGGSKGFDFTKIANNGSVLPNSAVLGASATDWGCTYDNVTGLMWEIKVNNPALLRHMGHTFTWYDSNPSTNGGQAGTSSGGGNCLAAGRCDTEKFVQDVNSAGLCGHNDWRLPRTNELLSIVDYGVSDSGAPTVDTAYFPNIPTSASFWSGSADARDATSAWLVGFYSAVVGKWRKSAGEHVRVVRVGP